MALSKSWTRFAARQAEAPPLEFVHGMRHTVKRGASCIIHSHRDLEIVYHPTGAGVTRLVGGPDFAFKEGGVVIYAPGQPHDQVMDSPGEDFCVQIALPNGKKHAAVESFHVPSIDDPSLLDEIRTLSLGRVRPNRMERTILNLRATSVLCALIQLASSRATGKPNRPKRYVQAAEQVIREHFAAIRTLQDVAERVGIGYDHLRHLFKAQRGHSLVQYLNEVRMERAKTLLVHSRLPLKQIATMCGFRDEYYFSAVFRRIVRMPPGKYRARLG